MTATRGVVQSQTDPVPLRICLRGDDSDGDLAVVEMVLDPGSGPLLHLHPTHGEGFYVLAGQLTVQIDQEVVSGGCCACSRRPASSGASNDSSPDKQVSHHLSGRPPNGRPASSGRP
jgi:hypothetical protein